MSINILKKLKALSGGAGVLESRAKIVKAVAAEETKLLRLICERVEADHALVEAETSVAPGEASDVDGARKRVDTVMAAIGRQAATLAGLRSRLAGQAPELEAETRAIQAALPEHIAGLKADFAAEWSKGAAAFGLLLGKRAALVALVGRCDLPDPQPVAVELEGAAEPWRAIEALKAGLDVIAGWGRAALDPQADSMYPGGSRPFDPQAVYVLTRNYDNLPSGTLLMESVLVPGTLRHLLNINYAELQVSQDWAASVEAGQRAAAAIESQAQRDALRKAEAEQEAAIRAMPATPLSQQRPNVEDSAEWKRQRDLAAGYRHDPNNDWPPEHVGTVSG